MKVKENVTIYQCEHCKKKMFRKHAMDLHEKWCTSNPENFVACSGCDNLTETTIDVPYDAYDGERYRTLKAFTCRATDKMLYPLKVLRKGLLNKYPETFEEQELMPKQCGLRHEANPIDDFPY